MAIEGPDIHLENKAFQAHQMKRGLEEAHDGAKDAVVTPNVGSVHNEIKGIFALERRFKKLLIFAICINEKAPFIILAPPDLEIKRKGALFSIA